MTLALSARENVTGCARQNVTGHDNGLAEMIQWDSRDSRGCLVSHPPCMAVPGNAPTETKALCLL